MADVSPYTERNPGNKSKNKSTVESISRKLQSLEQTNGLADSLYRVFSMTKLQFLKLLVSRLLESS